MENISLSRRNLPLVEFDELAPMRHGRQLPSSLRLPGPSEELQFKKLAAHLRATRAQILPNTPVGLTITLVKENQYQIQLHVSADLTADQGTCKDLHGAIGVFISRVCPGLTIRSALFGGNQNSEEGVGVFNVAFHVGSQARKEVDRALVAMVRIGRLLQLVDGNVSRLGDLLRDIRLSKGLAMIGPRLLAIGARGRMLAQLSEGVSPSEIQETASRLLELGHLDLATIILVAGMTSAMSLENKAELREAFLLHLVQTPVLTNDEDFEAAFALVVEMLPQTAQNDMHRERLIAPCYGLVNHLLNPLQMPAAALALLKQMHGNALGNLGEWENHCRDALEGIWDAIGGSIELMEDLGHAIESMPHDWAEAMFLQCVNTLFETRLARAVLESPQRAALSAKGFDFEYALGPDACVYVKPIAGIRLDRTNEDLITITIANAGAGGFVASEHGAVMIEYAESLLDNKPSVDHVSTFCLPVIDFLMDHFGQLSPNERPRLLALAHRVLKRVRPAMELPAAPANSRARSILKSAQALLEASVLYALLQALPLIDRKLALNALAWIHQNRKTLFSSLAPEVSGEILTQIDAVLGVFDGDLAVYVVDVEAARKTVGRLVPNMSAPFERAAVVYTPEATQVLFESWKALSGDDELSCHLHLLRAAQRHTPLAHAKQLIQAARAALEESLRSSNPGRESALELHTELLLFIESLQTPGPLPEWALTTLAEMASEPVYGQLRQVNPNAAAWPFWLHLQLSFENLSSDGCLAQLSRCAALQGVVSDDRADCVFVLGIHHLVQSNLNLDDRYPHALQAFEIWRTMPMMGGRIQGLLPTSSLDRLVSSLHNGIVHRTETRVDNEGAMLALMGQLLLQNEERALKHLTEIASNARTQHDYPMLGVTLCLRFARHFKMRGDTVHMQQAVALAFACMPEDPQYRNEMRDLLDPFLSPT